MATEENRVTYWVRVERGDGPEWERVEAYPMLYPAGHANALAASACDMRYAGMEARVPVRVSVWESERVINGPWAESTELAYLTEREPNAMWIRGPILTVDDARRILAGVHMPAESAEDAAWRNWAASEHDAVVAEVLDEEARRNRIAAEREAYADAVAVAGDAVADRLAEEVADAAAEGMFCPVPILVKGFPRECGAPLPCIRHPKHSDQ